MKVGVTVMKLPMIVAAGIRIPEHQAGMWAPTMSRADFKVQPGKAVPLQVVLVKNRNIRNPEIVYNRIRDLVNQFNASYRFGEKPYAVVEAGDMEKHWGAVEKFFGGTKLPPNIFVVDLALPPRRQAADPAYGVVKNILGRGGYLSQFVNFATYNHGDPRDMKRSNIILSGVARQVLSKCGVRVWWVNIPRSLPLPAVFVGVDVFHAPRKFDPKEGKRTAKESVAAIVVNILRSHEPNQNSMVEIYCETSRRAAGQEMDLGDIMQKTVANALRAFKVSPASCVVWRDGVGDNTINQVANQEIPAVRKAIDNPTGQVVGGKTQGKKVPLAYIICQKRISTKFLSADGESAMPCGSLVTGLQGPLYKTFYINGTSPPYSTPKPVRFIMAHRDSPLLPVSMSELSWALCHDYPNWTGPIKLPAPVQCAHKLAELAGGMADCGDSINHAKYAGKIYFL